MTRLAKFSLAAAIVMMVVSVGGFIVALVLNTFFLDKYDAYGEVPIPGSGSLHLPSGEVTVSLHTVVIGSPNGGLPVPPLGLTIAPPDGVAQPVMTENIGSTTTVNNDAHVRVWVAQIPASGTYNITTDGQVNGFINPRLAFGHKSSYGFLVWLFVAMFVVGLIDSILSGRWLARTRRKAVVAANPYLQTSVPFDSPTVSPVVPSAAFGAPPAAAQEPSDEGVRLERLKALAALRDSGALTEAEFEAEKRRILEGY
ncbi:MAG: SHOCT domain-containing protein [Mycobacterium sp.]|uniref:SHOCT domain-containing protein n=1 Tax=Mycobacterium sp. TaxID=1785 RepID=UPI003F95762B